MRPALERAAQAAPMGAACPPAAATTIERVETPDAIDCRRCGACCSYSAEWPRLSLESDAHIARIPREFIDESGRGMRCMGARCAALVGVVGEATSCAIYALRPDVCRTCSPGDAECLQARRHFGL
jgi:Fe-S-cluster containining protein